MEVGTARVWIVMNTDGEPFEGIGIAPDVSLTPADDISGEDLLIDRAVEMLSD